MPCPPRLVTHLLCNRQALRVVLNGLRKGPHRLVRDAEVRVRPALPCPATHLLCNQVLGVAQNCMWFRLGPSTSSSHALCLVPSLPRPTLAATEGKVLGRENDCEAFARESVRLSVYMCVRARATCAHVYVT